MKLVIHDWPDEQAVAILRSVHAAAGGDATVLLLETVLPEHDRDFPGKWVDLETLLVGSSRERTAAEYRDRLGQAGLRMTRVSCKPRRPTVSSRRNPRNDGPRSVACSTMRCAAEASRLLRPR